jgi:predicted Zn-dependent peptidase
MLIVFCVKKRYTSPKDLVASALVHRVLGSGARTKGGINSGGKISAAVSGDIGLKANATTFSSNYADSGLLGVFIAATPCSVEGV